MNISEMLNLLVSELEEWLKIAIQALPNLALAIVILVAFLVAAKLTRRLLLNALDRYSNNKAVNKILCTICYIAIIVTGMFAALGVLELNKTVTSLLAGAGVIGLALGFAFQEIASNFIAGILIAFRKPYQLGDIIEIEEWMGEVTKIDIRTTSITTFQGLEVMIPNKTMFTQPFINYTTTPKRRIDLAVGVSYGDDLKKVEEVSRAALEEVPERIESEEIGIWFESFGDSSINFVAHIWIEYPGRRNFLRARSEAIMNLKQAFDDNDITIPFPIRTLDFGIKGGERLGETLSAFKAGDKESKHASGSQAASSN